MQNDESPKQGQTNNFKEHKQVSVASVRARAAVLIICIVLVITVLATFVGIYFSNREISRTIEQNLTLVGELTSDMIRLFVTSIREPVDYVSAGMEEAYLSGGPEALGEALQGEANSGPNFISLAIAFPDDTIISRAKTEKDGLPVDNSYALPDATQIDLYRSMATEDDIRIGTVEQTQDGRHVIRCYKYLSDGMLFIATLPGEYFSQLIAQSQYNIFEQGKIFLVDSGRAVIATTDETAQIFSQVAQEEDGNDLAVFVTKALAGTSGDGTVIARYKDQDGVENICSYTPILHNPSVPDADRWVLILTVPVSATPAQTMTFVFLISGLIFLVCGIIASIFLSRMQARPYSELNHRNEELVLMREEAENVSKATSSFLANMSHEMRTPMNAVIGMTAIGKSAPTIEKKDYAFGKIDDASKHLLGVINDVLDMSKIEADKLELSPTDFDFERMLQQVVNVINFRIEERKQHFYVKVDHRIPRMLIGDDQRLAQVITNLLSNAVKFTPDEGTIQLNADLLSVEDDRYCLQISISDTGIGITDEQKARLFQSFTQAEIGTSRKFGGTGLGLAISKRIVELMDGEIWIESGPEQGSTFFFTVTLQRGSKQKENLLDEGVDWSNIRIFAVDDEPQIRQFFLDVSENLGIACKVAASGEEAVGLLAEEDAFDIHFIDWQLPGMNGAELARNIQVKKPHKSTTVIFSSADWSEIEEEARTAGVSKFLSKPLFQSTVVDTINECIGCENQMPRMKEGETYDDFSAYTILLAEDVEINREIIIALLEPTGVAVDCVENGAQAVELFTNAPDKYALIFMDVQMPEMDGYEATREIRAMDNAIAKEIPIIAMTANVFREDIEKCFEAGMNGHIGKPIDFEKMIDILREYFH